MLVAVAAALISAPATFAAADDLSFWVWNRSTPLTADESSALQARGVRELYWHIAEIDNRNGTWRWRKAPIQLPQQSFRIVPVVRIDPFGREPFSGESARALVEMLRAAIVAQGWSELQIDCDTPDRLLGSYAAALRGIHRTVPKLTATALAGWSKTPHWQALQESVDEIFPMFYDLDADPPGVGNGAVPRLLLEQASIDAQLRDWSTCRIPWRAGLPNFARVTVYDSTGKSRGHIRGWTWNDVLFNTALRAANIVDPTTVLLRADRKTLVAQTPVDAGEHLAARLPDRATLQHASDAATQAKARGVIFFRLPDRTAPGGWSLTQLLHLDANETPRVNLRRTGDGTLQLTNDSKVDIPPRFAGAGGDRDRGYALELDAPAATWREAMPGNFWRVTAHANAEEAATPVPVPLATRLTFWFSHMHAGDHLATGLIQTAPRSGPAAIRYRILNLPGADNWRAIE